MLRRIVEFSLRYRGVVLTLAAVLLGYGLYVASRAPLDVFPEFVQPQVTVQTEAPGLAPEQVETLVTRPVESVVNGAGELDSVRSESIQGLSVVTVVFKPGANIYTARQALSEKLGTLAKQLPEGVRAPTLSPLTSSTMDLLKIGLVSKGCRAANCAILSIGRSSRGSSPFQASRMPMFSAAKSSNPRCRCCL